MNLTFLFPRFPHHYNVPSWQKKASEQKERFILIQRQFSLKNESEKRGGERPDKNMVDTMIRPTSVRCGLAECTQLEAWAVKSQENTGTHPCYLRE